MITATRKTRFFAAAAAASLIATLAATIATAGADSGEMSVRGSFTASPPADAPDCPSPIDLCAEGAFSGVLHGTAHASATSLISTSQPGVYLGVADVVIHDFRGDVRCTETFVLNVVPGSDSEEGWICQVTGGTRAWTGASGHIEGYGSTPPGQDGSGRYAGTLVLP